jgi:hypothetical protein
MQSDIATPVERSKEDWSSLVLSYTSEWISKNKSGMVRPENVDALRSVAEMSMSYTNVLSSGIIILLIPVFSGKDRFESS